MGDAGVGKTNFLLKFINNTFTQEHNLTVLIDHKEVKTVLSKSKKTVKLQIWDTAGQEKYMSVNKNLFFKVQGILLFYSITDRESFEHIKNWIDIIRDTYNSLPILLIGNKKDDSNQRIVSENEGKQLAKNFNVDFMEASGKDNINVKEAFQQIAETVIEISIPLEKEIIPLKEKIHLKSAKRASC